MTVYSILLFLVAALLAWVGAMIYKGNTQLIHAYHQSKVSDADRPAYARAFAKGIFVLAAALLLSGVLALWGASGMAVSLIMLFAGLLVSFILLYRVQKEFNGGLF